MAYLYYTLVLAFFAVAAGTILFLLSELHKKFGFMSQFVKSAPQQVVIYDYEGKANAMKQFNLVWDRPFTVLIGFKLNRLGIEGFDYYGCVESTEADDKLYHVVVETYLGQGAAQFQFLLNQPFAEHNRPVLLLLKSGHHPPTAVYPPHFFQKYFGI